MKSKVIKEQNENNSWDKLSDEQLKSIIFSSAYGDSHKNAAKVELQKRINAKNNSTPTLSGTIINPLTKKFWWESVNLKGYPEQYPPVIYEGDVYNTQGSAGVKCIVPIMVFLVVMMIKNLNIPDS